MIYEPNQKEFEALINAPIDKRVKHFQDRVGGHCYFWTNLDKDGNLLSGYDLNNNECISVWPAKAYAEWFWTKSHFKNLNNLKELRPIEVHEFIDEYIDELMKANVYILVFPTDEGGALFDAENFKNMMMEELDKYGDYDEIK